MTFQKIPKFVGALTFLLLVGGLIRCQSSQVKASRAPNESEPSYLETLGRNFTSDGTDLTFAELQKILSDHQFSKIEQLLKYLREHKPEFMSRYTLVHDSKSLHAASKQNPRALVYGKTAGFVLSFNGAPEQRGYDMLEVLSFNPQRRAFEFYEIEFNEKDLRDRPPYKISTDGGPNQKCLGCHTGGRPIWEDYNHWPGVYGSNDDFPHLVREFDSIFLQMPGVSQRITKEWQTFKNSGLKKGRYAFLPAQANSLLPGPTVPRPNTDLGIGLFSHNMKRISRLIQEALPSDPKVKSLLLYATYCRYSASWMDGAQDLKKMADDFDTKYRPAAVERTAFLFQQEARHDGISAKQLRDFLGRNSYAIEQMDVTDETQFYRSLVKEIFVSRRIRDLYSPLFLGIVEKYLPKAQLATWPMNFFATYQFNDGLDVNAAFRKAFLEALYPGQNYGEDAELIKDLTTESQKIDLQCADLLRASGYPSNFRGYPN